MNQVSEDRLRQLTHACWPASLRLTPSVVRDDATEHVIRWSTAGAVVGVAAVAAVALCEHAYALLRAHGEVSWTGRLVPLTVDGLIYASSNGDAGLRASQGAGSRAGA